MCGLSQIRHLQADIDENARLSTEQDSRKICVLTPYHSLQRFLAVLYQIFANIVNMHLLGTK